LDGLTATASEPCHLSGQPVLECVLGCAAARWTGGSAEAASISTGPYASEIQDFAGKRGEVAD